MIASALQQHVYLPNLFRGASWLDPVFHFLFALGLLLAGARGRDKSLPKSYRLDRYRVLFLKARSLTRNRTRSSLEAAYENYRQRMDLKNDHSGRAS